MKHISEYTEEEKMMEAEVPTYNLSPNAPEFKPSIQLKAPVEFAIYNDGVPSMMVMTESDLYNVLQGIEDPLESFPPDAEDAAELEACDEFVEAMATLAFLEEQDERDRSEFSHVKKRWEVRRAEGLKGRPHSPKHSVDPVQHVKSSSLFSQDIRDIVPVMQTLHVSEKQRVRENKPRQNEKKMVQQQKHARNLPIQQPRKQN